MKSILKNRNIGLIIGLLVMLGLSGIFTPKLFDTTTLISMLRNNSIYVFLAVAEMLVIISGAIDLSGPSVLALSGCVCTILQVQYPEVPVLCWVVVALAIGLVAGVLNGFVVHYLKITPLIATLGTSYIIRGIAYFISDGNWWMPHQFTDEFSAFTTGKFLGVYNILWMALIVIVLAVVFAGHSTLGRRLYAVGSNKESAEIAGINVKLTALKGYMIAGGLCGLAGLMYVSNYAACNYSIASGYEMTAIVICMLGGVAITGGSGRVSGVFLAVLLMALINSFISMLPGLSIWQDAIQGFIIVVAVLLNVFIAKNERKQDLAERGKLI